MPVIIDGTNGITSPEPFVLTSGSLSSPAVAGQTEYDGKVFYQTPQGTQRGIVPGAQFFRLNSDLAGANVNTTQNVFGVGVTLSASTIYQFEAVYRLSKTAGTTSHQIGVGFGGTATINNTQFSIIYPITLPNTNAIGSASIYISNTVANTIITNFTTTASVELYAVFKGTVSINAGGTFIPQYTLSAAPGGAYTTAAGSYFLIYPIGASGANTSVGTWA